MLDTSRRLAIAGAALTLALPGTAMAHHGVHHGFARLGARAVPCKALEAGRTPARFTSDQITALKSACETRDAAIKAANAKFKTDTASARSTYRATVSPLFTEIRTARQNRRSACHADSSSQACADARAAFKTTLKNDLPKIRAATHAFNQAVAPAAHTRNQAIRAALVAFRAAVKTALS
jgi:hypothetical protein